MQTRKNRIIKALDKALRPLQLEVKDDSAKHAGHAGAQPEGETHYRLYIVAECFAGCSRVARHRLVNELLEPEFETGLHALSIKAYAPNEV